MPAEGRCDDDAVEPVVRKAAAWSWRLLVILAAVLAVLWLLTELAVIVVPVALAVILTALLLPRSTGSTDAAPCAAARWHWCC